MNQKLKWTASMVGVLFVATTEAAEYRIMFRGNEAIAVQSAAQPRAAGYVAPVGGAPGNLSASCPTCVPGGSSSPNHGAGVPNQIVTFLHPYTMKAVTVPLTLPVGKPTVVTKSDRIIYNYGLFARRVVVRFVPDGRVEVRYSS